MKVVKTSQLWLFPCNVFMGSLRYNLERTKIQEPGIMENTIRILIADDELEMRTLLQRTLSREGFSVDTASNGDDAISILQQDSAYDILISDIQMPGKGGEELVPEAKKLLPKLKIIVISGYAEIEQFLKMMNLGAFDYVKKPFKIPDLLDVIDRAMESATSS